MYITESTRKLMQLIGSANDIDAVGAGLSDTQRVLMSGDIVLMDTKTTDYNGRVCLIKRAEGRRKRRAEKRKEATAHD